MSSPGASDKAQPRILIYGYGNPGRQDDGAGVVIVEELAAWGRSRGLPFLAFDNNYQLNIEDALAAAQYDVVIFADASRDQPEGFRFAALKPNAAMSFTTHALRPEAVVALSQELYGACPAAYLLTVKGYEWEPNGNLTSAARRNIDAAKAFVIQFLESCAAPPGASPP